MYSFVHYPSITRNKVPIAHLRNAYLCHSCSRDLQHPHLERRRHQQWLAMAELGGMLAAAIIKVVAEQIGSAIGSQIVLQKNFNEDLKKMKMALESVDAVLEEAERRSITDKVTRLWLKRLKNFMYEISDMIDEFEADTQAIARPSPQKVPTVLQFSFKKYLAIIMIPCLTIGPKITMANKMNKMRKGLEVITGQHKEFKLTECTNANEQTVTDVRETSSKLERHIVGRTKEKDKILAYLSESMINEITVLPIYGIGGLGKTTLAKMVYNSPQFKEYSQVWVYVSQTFDLKKIGNSIISQLSEKNREIAYTEKQMIDNYLQKLLANKNILIVLDDLWENNKSHLEELLGMLKVGESGKVVVVVTTRYEDIAKKICTIQPHKLAPLKDDECWTIIKQKSDFESRYDQQELRHIGKDIASKCRGVALAAQSLGHMLHSLPFDEWESVRNSDFWNLSDSEDTSSTHTIGVNFENDTLFTMHDLVHDLARLVMADEILVSSKQGNTRGSCCHFALLNDCRKPLESSKIRALRFLGCEEYKLHDAAFSSAISLRVLDLSECTIHNLAYCIGELKQLRYLNAPRIQDAKIPDSITKLSKLIYLNLHGSPTMLALPESIGEIEGLLYLDLSGCSGIAKLPESFRRLQELVHLDMSNCSSVGGISVFLESLTQLEYLNLSCCQNIGDIPKALGGLYKLQYLNLSNSSYLQCCQEAEFLGALTKLVYLNLSSWYCELQKLPEALGRFTQLKYLNLSGWRDLAKLPRLFGSLKHLVHLDLSHCSMIDRLHEALVGLINLKYLNLEYTRLNLLPDDLTKLRYLNLSNLRNMQEDAFDSLINHICSNLSDLEYLDLSANYDIKRIPESICSLTKLHTLDLSRCNLKKVPESIHTIGSLKFLYLKGCDRFFRKPQLGGSTVSLPKFIVRAGDDESGSNLVLLQPTYPVELQIIKLENVKSTGEAHNIRLIEKKSLQDLNLEWTRGVKRFVDDKMLLEKLVPPSTLRKLEICAYNGISFPSWLAGQLPNLQFLVLRDMANLEEWNTSYSTSEEHVFQKVEIHGCPMLRMKPHLPKSKSWVIEHSDNVLTSWDECTVSHTSASSSSSPVTTWLSVQYCKVPLHQWRLLRHFPGLPSLSIHNCGDLTGSPEITQRLSSVETLCLGDKHMEELPKWLGELKSLENLDIISGDGVAELNENMRQLTKLQALELNLCNNITLPPWLGELTSLKELNIAHNGVLRSLPASIQQLTRLQEIQIINCPALEHVAVESEVGKMKLSHNQERVCVLPTSLKRLSISYCNGIKSLPQGIHQLTNLQELDISNCHGLEQWCELEENKMKLAHIEKKVCVLWRSSSY
nr:putative disease resistance protein RGA1 [Aegilops tauschii subsp. strangulata]